MATSNILTCLVGREPEEEDISYLYIEEVDMSFSKATFSYILMCFVPQFIEATDIITLESVIFPMTFCVYI